MLLKSISHSQPSINRFELLGDGEVGLSKAFAYLISSKRDVLYVFLRDIGVNVKNTENNFLNTEVIVEKKRNEGRTDIEIYQYNKFHVIIECKVGKNRIKEQRNQYNNSFNNDEGSDKYLCFITQEHDYNREVENEIKISYRGWVDILNLIDNSNFHKDRVVKDFIEYVSRAFKMRYQKEILIQDLSDEIEVKRYLDYNVYRRDVTFGNPLYFAPYFTRSSNSGEGIIYFSKVMGVLTITPDEIDHFNEDLIKYSELIDNGGSLFYKWNEGVKLNSSDSNSPSDDKYTYYFLADPVKLNIPLMKDQGKGKGVGKGWISRNIPKNRCVTFEDFMQRVISTQNASNMPQSSGSSTIKK